MHQRLPPWIRIRLKTDGQYEVVRAMLRHSNLNTVCESAQCPNRQECFRRLTATIMILGNICTRHCRFCAVPSGVPSAVDPDEPRRAAALVKKLRLTHAVITSVTRDDLPDGGAAIFARTVAEIRSATQDPRPALRHPGFAGACAEASSTPGFAKPVRPSQPVRQWRMLRRSRPRAGLGRSRRRVGGFSPPARKAWGTTVEVLTPDFNGSEAALAVVLASAPDVFNHNLETVERLQKEARPQASYLRSLAVLKYAATSGNTKVVKSGLMVGIGESDDELVQAMRDLRAAGCQALTIGQYLAPSKHHLPVHRFVRPEMFAAYREQALAMGFKEVAAGPLVRSSYMAESFFQKMAAPDTR